MYYIEKIRAILKKILDNENLVIVDVETTGLSEYYDEIIEICALYVRGGKIVDKFNTLINPNKPIPLNATRVNGITDEMVRNKPTIKEVLHSFDRFLQKIENPVFVGHNVSFDIRFLKASYEKYLGKTFEPQDTVCTMWLGTKIFGLDRYISLSALASILEIEYDYSSLHRASADALLVLKILQKIAKNEF